MKGQGGDGRQCMKRSSSAESLLASSIISSGFSAIAVAVDVGEDSHQLGVVGVDEDEAKVRRRRAAVKATTVFLLTALKPAVRLVVAGAGRWSERGESPTLTVIFLVESAGSVSVTVLVTPVWPR